jgi:5-formyltetrahydrofolate cyclo-ligase
MRTIRAEAAARDPDAAEKIADWFPMKLLQRYGPVVFRLCPDQRGTGPHAADEAAC